MNFQQEKDRNTKLEFEKLKFEIALKGLYLNTYSAGRLWFSYLMEYTDGTHYINIKHGCIIWSQGRTKYDAEFNCLNIYKKYL